MSTIRIRRSVGGDNKKEIPSENTHEALDLNPRNKPDKPEGFHKERAYNYDPMAGGFFASLFRDLAIVPANILTTPSIPTHSSSYPNYHHPAAPSQPQQKFVSQSNGAITTTHDDNAPIKLKTKDAKKGKQKSRGVNVEAEESHSDNDDETPLLLRHSKKRGKTKTS